MMQLTKQQLYVALFSALYTLGFGSFYVSRGNYEFLWYVAVLVFFFFLLLSTIRITKFPPVILWGLSLWGFLHMAGGSVVVGNDVLYGLQVLDIVNSGEFKILRFDQLVHAFGFGVSTLVAYHLMVPRWSVGSSRILLAFLAAGVGMGLGTVNEIVEFIAVLSFPETGVGGYINTSLDLVANMCGALFAAFVVAPRIWRK